LLEQSSTIEELASAFAGDLKAQGTPAEFSDEISRQLMQEFASFDVPAPAPGTLGMLVGRYAIRKDDFKIFDALMDGLKAAAGVSFFTAHQPVLGVNVAIGVSLAKLLRSMAMRGTFLNRDDLQVLTILKCNVASPSDPGLAPDEILVIARRTKEDADLSWLQQRLDYLEDVPTRDGATTKLASADPSGRWRSHV
jgi:hypothetical protein